MSEPAAGSGAARARIVTLVLLAALAMTSLWAAFAGERSAMAVGVLIALLVAPLALALPGLVRRDRRTFAWATLCVTPHFIYALTEVVANPSIRFIAAAMLVLALGLALALVAYLRLTRGDA